MFDELNVSISNECILKAIKRLNTGTNAGPGLLLNEFVIHGKDVLLPYLYSLFNKIFASCFFPPVWSEGFVIPLHKISINNVNNYRGITLIVQWANYSRDYLIIDCLIVLNLTMFILRLKLVLEQK